MTMRANPAAALLYLMLMTFPAAARIFWPSSDGNYLEGYLMHLQNCPAKTNKPCGVKLFADLQNSKVPDEMVAVKVAQDYIAAHPWPAVAQGYDLRFTLENHEGLLWHGLIHKPQNTLTHARIVGTVTPPLKSALISHIWVKPDGTAFYPVGYK